MKKEVLTLNGEVVKEIRLSFDDDVPTSQIEQMLGRVAVVTGIMELSALPKVTESRGVEIKTDVDFEGLRSIEFIFGPHLVEKQAGQRFQKILELLTGEDIDWEER
jgi:hypothetical protein